MPITPFIGVRISWLMFARNSLLARLAASAAILAYFSSTLGAFLFGDFRDHRPDCLGLRVVSHQRKTNESCQSRDFAWIRRVSLRSFRSLVSVCPYRRPLEKAVQGSANCGTISCKVLPMLSHGSPFMSASRWLTFKYRSCRSTIDIPAGRR